MTLGRIFLLSATLAMSFVGVGAAAQAAPGGELKMGRWVGHVALEGREEAFATTLDTLIVQPDDATQFPFLEAILRLSLGGYHGGEYESTVYQNIQYDFETGLLSFDEPGTEMSIEAYVYSSPYHIEGQVFNRATGQAGTIFLTYADDDEPGDDDFRADAPQLTPSLAGQYEGTCGGQRAALQIETGRGFGADSDATGLEDYGVRGALALEDLVVCSGMGSVGRPSWCVNRAYSSGSFEYSSGRLVLNANLGADTCELGSAGRLTCQVRIGDQNKTCELRKTDVATTPFSRGTQRYFIRTTAEQRRPLPEPNAPLHADLLAALGGTFSGYLYHEGKDRYQPVKLNVISSRSTPNPHNENGIYVSTTAMLHFGSGFSSDFWPHAFDRQPFYIRPGFMLHGEETDAQLQVTSWRMGVISGVWYSQAFGKVGAFELVKSPTLPPLAAEARFLPSIVGEFRGPRDRPSGFVDQWWLQTVVPTQPVGGHRSVLLFQGVHQMFTDSVSWPRRQLQRATYDVYAGAVAFLADHQPDEPTFVLGRYETNETMRLFWPGAQKWGVGIFDYGLNTYARTR